MNLVEQHGEPLYLVHEDRLGVPAGDLLFRFTSEELGRPEVPQERIGLEKVDGPRVFSEGRANQGALPGLARAEQEKRTVTRKVHDSVNHDARMQCILASW